MKIGTLRGRNRGPKRVQMINLGSPCKDMRRNWKNVKTDPALGCSDVICSSVRALLQHPPKIRERVVAHPERAATLIGERGQSREQVTNVVIDIAVMDSSNMARTWLNVAQASQI